MSARISGKEKPAREGNPCGPGATTKSSESNMPEKNQGRKSRVSLDAILASAPVNSTAALVVGKGTHWAPLSYRGEREWSTPPDIGVISSSARADPNFRDFTGTALGRLVCVGIAAEPRSKSTGGSKWVMRCSCSNFVIRSTRALKKQANSDDCCSTCQALRAIRHYQTPKGQRQLREREAS